MKKFLHRVALLGILIPIGFIAPRSPASATTYDYVGKPFTNFNYPGCYFCELFGSGSLSGFVTFNFDTSNFTGTATLSDGDLAQLFASVSNGSFQFPYYLPPPNVYTTVKTLSGSFTFVNGSITDWDFYGRQYQQACGSGPGCAAGSIYAESTPTSDYVDIFDDNPSTDGSKSNDGGGVWIMAPAVPEPSTWAMLLIGFAGIGYLAHRQSGQRRTRTS